MVKLYTTIFIYIIANMLLNLSKSNGQVIDNLSNGANGMVRGYFIDSINNELFLGGQFNVIYGANCNQIAKLTNTGCLSLGFNDEFKNPGIIYSITKYNNEIIVGGSFDSIGNQAIKNIARFDGSVWHQVGDGLNNIVSVLKVYNDTLYAGGEFDSSGTILTGALAKYNNTDWVYPDIRFNGSIFSLIIYNGDLLIGGNFQTTVGNYIVNHNSNGYFGNYAGLGNFVIKLNIVSDTLYACGSYTLPTQYLSSYYNNSWNQYTVPTGGQNWVTSIIDFNGERYVSGYFAYDVAKYTSTGFIPILNIPGYVSDLFVFQNKLFMIGWYENNNIGLKNICALIDTNVEIKSIAKEIISVFPNPIRNELNIKFPFEVQFPVSCIINNVYGENLKQYNLSSIDNTLDMDIPAGVYVLSLKINHIEYSFSIIKL